MSRLTVLQKRQLLFINDDGDVFLLYDLINWVRLTVRVHTRSSFFHRMSVHFTYYDVADRSFCAITYRPGELKTRLAYLNPMDGPYAALIVSLMTSTTMFCWHLTTLVIYARLQLWIFCKDELKVKQLIPPNFGKYFDMAQPFTLRSCHEFMGVYQHNANTFMSIIQYMKDESSYHLFKVPSTMQITQAVVHVGVVALLIYDTTTSITYYVHMYVVRDYKVTWYECDAHDNYILTSANLLYESPGLIFRRVEKHKMEAGPVKYKVIHP